MSQEHKSARPHIVVPDDLPERVVDLEAQMQRMEATILPPNLTGIGTALDALGKRLEGHHVSMDALEKGLSKADRQTEQAAEKIKDLEGILRDGEVLDDIHRRLDGLARVQDSHIGRIPAAEKRANRALELARVNRQAGDAVSADVGKLARALGALECRVNDLAGPGEPKMDAAMVDMRRELARLAQLGIEHDNSIGEAFDRLNDMKSALRDLTTPEPLSFGAAPTPEPADAPRCLNCGCTIDRWADEVADLKVKLDRAISAERAAVAELHHATVTGQYIPEDLARRVLAWDRAGDMAEGNALILMDAIQRHLREAPTVPEPCDGWIPVGERLPDDGVEVLAWGCWAEDQTEEDWRLWHANYGDGHGGGWWTVGQCREALSPVTHWMPLPPPPKS